MMTSNMKSILFAFVIITIFVEGEPQSWLDMSLLQNEIVNFLFPKDPGLIKVRRIEETRGINNAKVLDFVGLVEQYGYPAEEHNVTTEDGYILTIHRIPGSPLLDKKGKKEVVFIQHGVLASSDTWVLYGPGKDLAFLLADQGYDIWIGNVRGNTYCRSHVKMTTYDRKFWQFSFHEIGMEDLPAMLDYVLNYTGQKNLSYIGHSMGTTALFVLLSMRPEYNEKIKIAICLAPVGSWITVTPTFNEIINILPTLKKILDRYEIYDIFPQSLTTVTVGRVLCNDEAMTQTICITLIFFIVGSDPTQLNTTTLPKILSHFPAGASVKTLHHYYQNAVTNNFRDFDYGVVDNYKRYKQETPPSYDLKKITVPLILFYGANDMVATEQNVLELSKQLPNILLIEQVPHKLFNHADFTWAIDAKTLIYDRMLELIQKFDVNQTVTTK